MRHLKGEKIAKFLGSLVAEAVPPAETLKEQAGGTDRRGRRRRKKKGAVSYTHLRAHETS